MLGHDGTALAVHECLPLAADEDREENSRPKLRWEMAAGVSAIGVRTPYVRADALPFLEADLITSGCQSINMGPLHSFLTELPCFMCDLASLDGLAGRSRPGAVPGWNQTKELPMTTKIEETTAKVQPTIPQGKSFCLSAHFNLPVRSGKRLVLTFNAAVTLSDVPSS